MLNVLNAVYVVTRCLIGLILLVTPILYTFLRLAEKIGPPNLEEAFAIGAVLWFIGIFGCLIAMDFSVKEEQEGEEEN